MPPKLDKRSKIYSCLRQTENWSHMESQYKFDKVMFKPEAFIKDMATASPKLVQLFQIIADVDALDLKTHGHYFKHFIFSDVKEKLLSQGTLPLPMSPTEMGQWLANEKQRWAQVVRLSGFKIE